MSLSNHQLDAFFAGAQALNFTRAAQALHITQSALTQRIQLLEAELGLTLFVRKARGVDLTPAGQRLLHYCQARSLMEAELAHDLGGSRQPGLGGVLRLSAFSSVARSVVLPALAPILAEHPRVEPHLGSAEMRQLPQLLDTGAVDYIVLDHALDRADLETTALGEEVGVLVERASGPGAGERYLDHDPDDPTTAAFFRAQGGKIPKLRRGYLDEIYAILDGVALGLGAAVVPRHLASRDPRVWVVPKRKPRRTPVVLHYFRQPFYTALHKAVVAALEERCPAILGS